MARRGDYIAISAILKLAHTSAKESSLRATEIVEDIAKRLADYFERDSLTFRRDLFYSAIGLEFPEPVTRLEPTMPRTLRLRARRVDDEKLR